MCLFACPSSEPNVCSRGKQGRAAAAAAMTTAAVGGRSGVGVVVEGGGVGDGGSLPCQLAMLIFSSSGHRVGFTFVA